MEVRARATGAQFALMLEFMESHGDLAKPQGGPQGRLRSDRLWLELSNALNAIGGGAQRTPDKWKKVWADWKSKTKKKTLVMRQHAGGTGGGPNSRLTLSAFEERILAILGSMAVEGDSVIEEQGINLQSQQESADVEGIDLLAPSTSSTAQPPRLPSSPPRQASPPSPQPPSSPPPQPYSPMPRQPLRTPPRRGRRRAHVRSPNSIPSPVRHAPSRRRRALTPFDRATSEFVEVEQRRLQLEEKREENEARKVQVEEERNRVLNRFADIAEFFVTNFLNR